MIVRPSAFLARSRSVRALLALAVTTLPALAAEPAECARYRELKAAGHQQEAERMLNVCHDKKRQARAQAGSAAPATSPTWANDLPTVAKVRSSIKGSDAADTALRQQSAFNTMRELIGDLSGFAEWPPAAAARMKEYERVAPHPATLPPNPYDRNLDFQRELLAKLVSPPTARAYEASSAPFQRLANAEREKQQAEAQRTKKQAQEERRKVAAAAAVEAAAPAWIKSDVAKARAAHVDTAFGLEFGRPLELPTCDMSDAALQQMMVSHLTPGAPRGAPKSCSGDLTGQAMGSGLLNMFSGLRPLGGDHATIPGGQLVGVGLASDKCPPWLTCSLGASVTSGVLVGLTIGVSDDAKSMKQATAELTRKYGRPSGTQHIECTYATHSTAYASNGEMVSVPTGSRTLRGDALSWSNAGMYVAYVPYTGTQCSPWLYVELASVHASAVGAISRAEATAPKM